MREHARVPGYSQCAHDGFQRAMQRERAFLQRVAPQVGSFFDKFESATSTSLMESLLGEETADRQRSWNNVPIKRGGMTMPKATELADLSHQTSVCQCAHLVKCMKGWSTFDHVHNSQEMSVVRLESSK